MSLVLDSTDICMKHISSYMLFKFHKKKKKICKEKYKSLEAKGFFLEWALFVCQINSVVQTRQQHIVHVHSLEKFVEYDDEFPSSPFYPYEGVYVYTNEYINEYTYIT